MKIINWAGAAAALMRCRLEINYQIQTWKRHASVTISSRFSALCLRFGHFAVGCCAASRTHHPSFDALFTRTRGRGVKFEYIGEAVFASTSVAEAARFPARLTNCALLHRSSLSAQSESNKFSFQWTAAKNEVPATNNGVRKCIYQCENLHWWNSG